MDPMMILIIIVLIVLAMIYKDVSAFILTLILLGIWTLLMVATASAFSVACFIVDKIKRTQ